MDGTDDKKEGACAFLAAHSRDVFFWISLVAVIIAANMGSVFLYDNYFHPPTVGDPMLPEGGTDNDGKQCSILGIALHGELVTYTFAGDPDDASANSDVSSSEDITRLIATADADPEIKAILFDVDSPGGSPVAGEEIANAIRGATKPVVAVIRGVGASAAYWGVSSADRIYASRNSDVGSIGVTTSYLDNTESNKKNGIVYNQLSSGKYKDTFSPDKPLTKEERDLIMRDIMIMHDNFVENIATNRNLPLEAVREIADGSSVLGEQAKDYGLIDEIGGLPEAKKYLEEKTGESLKICW